MHKSSYIIRFVFIITAIVALVLSIMSTGLQEVHKQNELVFNKRAILKSISTVLDKKIEDMSDPGGD